MKTYIFHGKVIPERTQVNLTGLPEMEFLQPDSGLQCRLILNIILSEVSVSVTSKEDITDLYSLKNYITDTVSLFVDCIGYDNGCGYVVEIDTCAYNEGKSLIVFGVKIDELENKGQWKSTKEVIEAYSHATDVQKVQLQRALTDLKRGIKISYDTAFYSYRSIESIKQTFIGDTDGTKWRNMNSALNINRSYTDTMRTNHANSQRHGASTFMTSADRIAMLIKTKTIISRFVSYIENNCQNLNITDYPELS